MDVVQLKEYILENHSIATILESIKCHHIKFHSSGYWSCANKDGDNKIAITVKENEYLSCTNHTRQIVKINRTTDLIDLVCFNEKLSFPEGLKFICSVLGIDYYHDFDNDVPASLLMTRLILSMNSLAYENSDKPLKPISEKVLTYYKPFVNDMFKEDNIDYMTQREFEIGYDDCTNRITIPIRSEIGDLVGVKGRLLKQKLDDDDLKYLYIEPCSRAKILYGLHHTHDFIKSANRVFVVEAEKGVLQLWSMGYRNSVATGGKELSTSQIELLTRLGADIVLCFDRDVQRDEIEGLADRFADGIPIFNIYDDDNILNDKESPTDNPQKWIHMQKNNIHKIK